MIEEIKDFFIDKLKEKECIIESVVNYRGFAYFITTNMGVFCITYKREWYKKYGFHFNEDNKWGQVASESLLGECLKRGAALYCFSLPSLKIYCIEPNVFLESGKKVKHLKDHLAVNVEKFNNFDNWLEDQYAEWC